MGPNPPRTAKSADRAAEQVGWRAPYQADCCPRETLEAAMEQGGACECDLETIFDRLERDR